ncbi:L-arabinose isomerase [Caproicibacter fermentans]|uniref:L-arabinose isomerase n=2 Tax=Caproicibacter fermentans TaxID=2576756 RepID=A0A7G8TEX4_9FIRM|nr:L-arabinose isomerase [Caproicibacter fermentans]QNK42165.1 L-arabinose isomerase [Caproicibacter fermentans]
MNMLKDYEFWFVVGSQSLYGPEVLETVAQRAREMAEKLSESKEIPCRIVYKATVETEAEGTRIMLDANYDERCAGVITWCHTFSPSKMWIHGLQLLQKPWCHFATQYNRHIPDKEIDMDYMNLNQSAHGDREHGFIGARMRLSRKVVVGYWEDASVRKELGSWMRSAVGAAFSRKLRLIRFGDNMRDVAVTEGDKVEAEIKLGWQVDYWPVGHLAEVMNEVSEQAVDSKMEEYRSRYLFATDDLDSVRCQAREEIAIRRILKREGALGFVDTFQDLYGMEQLPGLASQNIMADGMGFGAEGDWKISGMTAIVKAMGEGLEGGSTFMEDYNYDLEPGGELSLGAHMLEVCPSVAAEKPRIEIHPLSIGDRKPPARLVFEGAAGTGAVISLIDMGGRLRLIVQDIECIRPTMKMENLPVARVMWKSAPDLLTGLKCWILAGGAHHSVLTTQINAGIMEDWAEIMGIEFVHISSESTAEGLKQQLFLNDLAWKLK